MERKWLYRVLTLAAVALVLGAPPAAASHLEVQCPGDTNGNALQDGGETWPANQKCMHLTSGDGFVTMANGEEMYMFGFADATGHPTGQVMVDYILAGAYPGPIIVVDEGDEFYLSLSNVGMLIRPDLFDPHTVHWHGFPQASSVFDGLPESGIAINMGATLTYYYNVIEPGTYMYHCHVEATEHMQMGMLANLYVRPAQNGTELGVCNGAACTKFAYNDGDGSTGYDREYPIQMSSFDSAFHTASETVQPLPFALMRDDYPMLNGRGYPDTVNPAPLPAPTKNGGIVSQVEDSLILANEGDRVLLRISNIAVTRYYTLASLSLPLTVVGRDARLLRGPTGIDLYYQTNSVTLGGGETADAVFTAPAYDGTSGDGYDTYFLYTTNLNYLNNSDEVAGGMGGMMTEIRVYPAGSLAPQTVMGAGQAPVDQLDSRVALGIE
jgi:FtsP/CotA-like multicopper oxidase with cupredoxin domain